MADPTVAGARGRCWQCGYRLDGIPSRRCPECGREFDPDNPKTMNMTGSNNRIARWFIRRPLGKVSLGIAAAATLLIVITTGLPVALPDFTFGDIRLFIAQRTWREMWRHFDRVPWTDCLFIVAIELWMLLLLMLGLRAAVRAMLARRYGPEMVRASRGNVRAFLGLLAAAAVLLPIGAEHRIAKDWVGSAVLARPPTGSWGSIPSALPGFSPEREDGLLRYAMRWLGPRDRMMAAGIVVETRTARGLPMLLEAYSHERDASVRAGLLMLIGMYRNAGTAPLLAAAMDDSAPEVRAAGADALGILHAPGYRIPLGEVGWMDTPLFAPVVDGRASFRIALGALVELSAGGAGGPLRTLADAPITLPEAFRQKLEHMMLAPGTAGEHAAAARALLRWPPQDFTLRVAEWGVWINDGGQLKLVKSVLDEIPPMVHRLGNSKAELMDRVNQIMFITKPIIHVTVNHPMAVDIRAEILGGRPWFAYPKPDDLTITARDFSRGFQDVNPDGTPKLDMTGRPVYKPSGPTLDGTDPPAGFGRLDGWQGYPAMEPKHPKTGSIGGLPGARNDIASAGVRWQSLIVSPELPAWAKPAAVPADSKYNWWNRLRQVNTSYVISRDEAERFLYYDGPTNLASPVDVSLAGDKLDIKTPGLPPGWPIGWGDEVPDNGMQQSIKAPRAGLFIRVRGGKASAAVIPEGAFDKPGAIRLPALAADAPALLLQQLIDGGLTREEAQGMLDVWRPQFFETDGDRLLVRLSSSDYDAMCPIRIEPKPTTIVRVGILLKELGKN